MFSKFKSTIDNVIYIVTLLAVVSSAISGFIKGMREFGAVFWVSIAVLAGCLVYVVINYYRQRSVPISSPGALSPDANLLRGIDPFEKGQVIIGRDLEIKELITIIERHDFTFGYVSGDAGAGKTSLVRAGIWQLLVDKGWSVYYFGSVAEIIDLQFDATGGQGAAGRGTAVFDEKTVTEASGTAGAQKTLFIIDQFEEFFVNRLRKNDRVFFSVQLSNLIKSNRIKVLLCLRKEFVEDLRSLSPAIQEAKSDETSVYVENWDLVNAKEYFKIMCDRDGAPFSLDLRQEIVEDIAANGIVRPIELQIVCEYCKDSTIKTLGEFKKAGRSKGILSTFIKKTINKTSTDNLDLEKLIGKYMLRSLCDPTFDTKRADGGIDQQSLFEEVKRSLERSWAAQEQEDYNRTFPIVLDRFVRKKLILPLPKGRLNLYHDYLVKGIKEFTADIRTVGEIASGIVEKYLSRRENGFKQLMPVKEYLFIRRNLPKEAYMNHDTRVLIRDQKRAYLRYVFVTTGLLALLVTYFFRPGVDFSKPIPVSRFLYQSMAPKKYRTDYWVKIHDSTFCLSLHREGTDTTFLEFRYNDISQGSKQKDTVLRRVRLQKGISYQEGKDIAILNMNEQKLYLYDISNGEPLVRTLQVPFLAFSKDDIGLIGSRRGDNQLLGDLRQLFYIDFNEKKLLINTTNGIIYSGNYDSLAPEIKPYSSTAPKYSIMDVEEVGGDMLITTPSIADTSFILSKTRDLVPIEKTVNGLFNSKKLFYDQKDQYLVYVDTLLESVSFFRPFVPTQMSELNKSLFSFQLSQHDFETLTIFGRYENIRVFSVDKDVYFAAIPTKDTARLFLWERGNVQLLPYKGENLTTFYATAYDRTYCVVKYGNYSYDYKYISTIDKYDHSKKAFYNYNMTAVRDLDSGRLQFIYIDSMQYLHMGIMVKATNEVKQGEAVYFLNGSSVGNFYWSKSSEELYYTAAHSLYFSNSSEMARLLISLPAVSDYENKIDEFFVQGNKLYVKSGDGYFLIKKYFKFWGIPLWRVDWPDFTPGGGE